MQHQAGIYHASYVLCPATLAWTAARFRVGTDHRPHQKLWGGRQGHPCLFLLLPQQYVSRYCLTLSQQRLQHASLTPHAFRSGEWAGWPKPTTPRGVTIDLITVRQLHLGSASCARNRLALRLGSRVSVEGMMPPPSQTIDLVDALWIADWCRATACRSRPGTQRSE